MDDKSWVVTHMRIAPLVRMSGDLRENKKWRLWAPLGGEHKSRNWGGRRRGETEEAKKDIKLFGPMQRSRHGIQTTPSGSSSLSCWVYLCAQSQQHPSGWVDLVEKAGQREGKTTDECGCHSNAKWLIVSVFSPFFLCSLVDAPVLLGIIKRIKGYKIKESYKATQAGLVMAPTDMIYPIQVGQPRNPKRIDWLFPDEFDSRVLCAGGNHLNESVMSP